MDNPKTSGCHRHNEKARVTVNKNLFVSLLSSSKARSVVVSKTQEVVIGHQALDRVSHHIYVQGLLLRAISTQKEKG